MGRKVGLFPIFVGVFVMVLVILGNVSPNFAAETYPSRPINLIVGFTPGGASDLSATVIAEKWEKVLGQPIVKVHKPGAGGIIAASYVRRSKPDGYTLLLTVSSMFLPTQLKKLDYTLDDFTFIGRFTTSPIFAAVQAKSKWKNLKDFVEDAKRNPGEITYATTGTNVAGYFVAQKLSQLAGIRLKLVPFKSCGDAAKALLGGHVDSYFCPGVGAVGEKELVRVLAIPMPKRLEGFENIPTFTELGYPFVYSGGHSILAPKATPSEVAKKLVDTLKITMQKYSKEIRSQLKNANLIPYYMGPQETKNYIKDLIDMQIKIIEEAHKLQKK